jgi:dihydropteroate synthase type 2
MPSAGVTIFGIVNVTRDSFSDGGRYFEPADAIAQALALAGDGADVIDLGAASSHPEAEPVSADEEIRRLAPVLQELVRRDIAVSVDSWQPEVQRFAVREGATWLNDIRGFPDEAMRRELAASSVGLVAMHSIAEGPRATREKTDPTDVFHRVVEWLAVRVGELEDAGIDRERIVLDPGMGLFLGADPEPSILVLQHLDEIVHHFRLPVLISVSRKSLVGRLAKRPVAERGAASLAAELFAVEMGATYIRTHDPRPLRDALEVTEALRRPVL